MADLRSDSEPCGLGGKAVCLRLAENQKNACVPLTDVSIGRKVHIRVTVSSQLLTRCVARARKSSSRRTRSIRWDKLLRTPAVDRSSGGHNQKVHLKAPPASGNGWRTAINYPKRHDTRSIRSRCKHHSAQVRSNFGADDRSGGTRLEAAGSSQCLQTSERKIQRTDLLR